MWGLQNVFRLRKENVSISEGWEELNCVIFVVSKCYLK